MDASKLESWLPVLQHPEYGAAICEAAGVAVDQHSVFLDVGGASCGIEVERSEGKVLTCLVTAALAFGTLAVMADERMFPGIEKGGGRYRVADDQDDTLGEGDTPAAAVLAAAYCWLGIGGDK